MSVEVFRRFAFIKDSRPARRLFSELRASYGRAIASRFENCLDFLKKPYDGAIFRLCLAESFCRLAPEHTLSIYSFLTGLPEIQERAKEAIAEQVRIEARIEKMREEMEKAQEKFKEALLKKLEEILK